ncbi:hypothetical protein [Kosmotoga pacifica]|uniref:hypothetical protein n=1 Tax=Kosmotoga pacifica TaxID=1330330 RepID=UPI00069B1CE1|nr:hypothetical protein [Kosmotoga pacifica]
MKTYNLIILYGQVVAFSPNREKAFFTLRFSENGGQEIKVIFTENFKKSLPEVYKGSFVLVEGSIHIRKTGPYLLAKNYLVTSRPYDRDLGIELPRLLYGNVRKTSEEVEPFSIVKRMRFRER